MKMEQPIDDGRGELDFASPEARDFADLQAKVDDLNKQVAAAEKGIKLAQSLGDANREADLQKKLIDLQATLVVLTAGKSGEQAPHVPQKPANDDGYDWSDQRVAR